VRATSSADAPPERAAAPHRAAAAPGTSAMAHHATVPSHALPCSIFNEPVRLKVDRCEGGGANVLWGSVSKLADFV